MLYAEFMHELKDMAIVQDEENGMYSIRPDYRYTASLEDLDPKKITDFAGVTWDIIREDLELDVVQRNQRESKIHLVVGWLYDLLTTAVDPFVTQEENELIQNIVEYMAQKDKLVTKEAELEKKEDLLNKKEDLGNVVQMHGLNFAKRKADE